VTVTVVGMRGLSTAIRKIEEHIGTGARGRRQLLGRLGRMARDETRGNITTQGGGGWKKLSRWTQAKTGRRKALLPLRGRIKHRYDAETAEVYFEQTSPFWNLDTHHFGRTSRPVKNKHMRIPIPFNRGQIKAFTGGGRGSFGTSFGSITIYNRKASVLPARPVWASKRQLQAGVQTGLRNWLRELEQKVK
jgi:hypothetical protein